MRYFVKYCGDLEKDPLDCGSEDFLAYQDAREFAYRMRNKGLTCQIYNATIIDEAEREGRELALAELTQLDQEMGFYNPENFHKNPLIKDSSL